MAETELHGNRDGYVLCPLRGELLASWCAGCGYRLRMDQRGERAVVVCAAEPQDAVTEPVSTSFYDDLTDLALQRTLLSRLGGH